MQFPFEAIDEYMVLLALQLHQTHMQSWLRPATPLDSKTTTDKMVTVLVVVVAVVVIAPAVVALAAVALVVALVAAAVSAAVVVIGSATVNV